MTGGRVRVLVVSDGIPDQGGLVGLLHASAEFETATAPASPRHMMSHVQRTRPDVVCLDITGGNAVSIIELIMAEDPRPILVLTPAVEASRSADTFAVLDAGAVDVMPRPARAPSAKVAAEAAELRARLRVLAGVRVTRRRAREVGASAPKPVGSRRSPRAIVIGASTGGPMALARILEELPRGFPLPILCVQHIAHGFLPGLVEWLDRRCELRIKQAEDGEVPRAGTVYLPREDVHLLFDERRALAFSGEAPIDGHRPSVTATMRSAARRLDGAVVGVLLTGMGRDGVDGMAEIAKSGGVTIAQDEASSVVFGMPSQAIAAGCVQHVLALDRIAARLVREASSSR